MSVEMLEDIEMLEDTAVTLFARGGRVGKLSTRGWGMEGQALD
jgi:hypothetical protein